MKGELKSEAMTTIVECLKCSVCVRLTTKRLTEKDYKILNEGEDVFCEHRNGWLEHVFLDFPAIKRYFFCPDCRLKKERG